VTEPPHDPPPQPPAGQRAVEAPRCYRHPDRETWIRCARCERPICPDCMTSAAVGFQCPECVREGAATQRAPRTVLGARIDGRGAPVTLTLIGINVAVFILDYVLGLTGGADVKQTFGVVGLAVGLDADGAPQVLGIADGEWYRLVTAMFVHGSVFHLLFNVWALWLVGPLVESVAGRWRYLALYLTCGLAGATASYVFNDPRTLSVGASGAIFGLFGAVLVIQRRMGRQATEVLALIGLNLVLGFVIPNIDWRAHVGGLVAGMVLTAVLAFAPRAYRNVAFGVAVLAVVAICLVAAQARSSDLRADLLAYPVGSSTAAGLTMAGEATRE